MRIMTAVWFAGSATAAYLITLIILPAVKEILIGAGFIRPNFRTEEIPSGLGLVFFPAALITTVTGRLLGLAGRDASTFLLAVGAMGLFGLIDDVFGTRGASGLKGHLKKLVFAREITTGGLKALAGVFIGLLVSLEFAEGTGVQKWLFMFLNTLVIALLTNAINLLDLRPGRAGKGFLVMAGFIALAGSGKPQLLYLATMVGSLLAFLPLDLKALAMMGDTGSNMLGMALGYTAVFVLAGPVKIGLLIFLVGFHLLTEKYSLTRIIENNRVLNYLDLIGRRQ